MSNVFGSKGSERTRRQVPGPPRPRGGSASLPGIPWKLPKKLGVSEVRLTVDEAYWMLPERSCLSDLSTGDPHCLSLGP